MMRMRMMRIEAIGAINNFRGVYVINESKMRPPGWTRRVED